ncbi:hypothetical protein ACC728_37560, partial [Rhizobium ruizarguesonis]
LDVSVPCVRFLHPMYSGVDTLSQYLENHSGCRIFDPTLRRTIADGLWPVWEFPNTARSASPVVRRANASLHEVQNERE